MIGPLGRFWRSLRIRSKLVVVITLPMLILVTLLPKKTNSGDG